MAGATSSSVKQQPGQLERVRGVELFATGTFRGKQWRLSDLDEMCRNARRLGPQGLKLLRPPTVLGHEEDQPLLDRTDWPAAAWLDPNNVRVQRYYEPRTKRTEGILIGDLTDVPPAIAALIRAKKYRKVSAEIYDDFTDDFGRSYGKAIRRIALLGGEVPQVKRLKDIPNPEPQAFSELRIPARVMRLAFQRSEATPRRTTVYTFAESAMERTQMIAAVQAAMPSLSQSTLDAMTDDQLADLVKALPTNATAATTGTPAAATDPNAAAAMSDDDGYEDMDDTDLAPTTGDGSGMSHEDLIQALTDLGQDPADLDGLSDEDLQALYEELSDNGDDSGNAVTSMGDPSTMSHEELVQELTAAGQDPTTLDGMSDEDLKALYAQLLGGGTTTAAAAPAPADTSGTSAMSDRQRRQSAGKPKPQKKTSFADLEARRAMTRIQKLNRFAELNYKRTVRNNNDQKKRDAHSFCDQLVREGRISVAQKTAMMLPLLLKLDDLNPVHAFSENGSTRKLTAYELKKKELAKLPVITKYGEKLVLDPKDAKTAASAEVNKVEKFVELNRSHILSVGGDPNAMVALAKKHAEKDPQGFRAEKIIGRDGVALVGG